MYNYVIRSTETHPYFERKMTGNEEENHWENQRTSTETLLFILSASGCFSTGSVCLLMEQVLIEAVHGCACPNDQ
jgi:hypothetical protein